MHYRWREPLNLRYHVDIMMILARPSISTYLARTLYELGVEVVLTENCKVPMKPAIHLLDPEKIKADPKLAYRSLLLTNLENALSFLYQTIPYDDRIMKAKLFKDKVAFREAISKKFKDFYFRGFSPEELTTFEPSGVPFPVVLKPSIGISSIGVIRVNSAEDWSAAVQFLTADLKKYQQNYSSNVVEGQRIIVETCIEGKEFAIDGYFDEFGAPVVLNLLEHIFSGPGDTSDRIYYTRKSLIKELLPEVTLFLKEFGEIFDLKRFPFHIELRKTPQGRLIPIELNPLRFSGLGTTEIAQYAYGINVYELFFRQTRPDWSRILNRDDDSIYGFCCADIPTELFRKPGLTLKDREFSREFSEILEYRIEDERDTSTFAVVFFRTEEIEECYRLLSLDLKPFMSG